MSHHKVLSLLVSHSICSSSLVCLSTKPDWVQFHQHLIAIDQNGWAKSIVLFNCCPFNFDHLLVLPFCSPCNWYFISLEKMWHDFCCINCSKLTTKQKLFFILSEKCSVPRLYFIFLLTTLFLKQQYLLLFSCTIAVLLTSLSEVQVHEPKTALVKMVYSNVPKLFSFWS